MRRRGPRVLAAARGRAGLGSGARGPGTLGSAPAAAAAAQEPQRLDAPGCGSPCACAAPGGRGGERGEKLPAPGCVCMGGCPGPGSRWSGMLEASVTPGPGAAPRLGLAARVPLQATSSEQPRARPGGQEEAPEGWTPRNGRSLCPLGGARHCAAKSQVGVSAPSHPQTLQLGTRSLHSIPSNFRGRGAWKPSGGDPHKPRRDPLFLNTLRVPPYLGSRKGELTRMVTGRGCGVRWGGLVYVWDSVHWEMCNVGAWTRAPAAAGGAGWWRAHVRVSGPWRQPKA